MFPLSLRQFTNRMPIKEKITPDEANRFKQLALRTSFEISQECGPSQGEHRAIFGFNGRKAEQIIEDMIWEFLMKG